jgi:hypothetical protein
MEQLKKEVYASNTPIIVSSKAVNLKHEHDMVVEWKFNHILVSNFVLDSVSNPNPKPYLFRPCCLVLDF